MFKQTIKKWAETIGIKIKNPSGFKGRKNNIWNKLYTEEQFKKGIKKSYITVKTEKGLDYLKSK